MRRTRTLLTMCLMGTLLGIVGGFESVGQTPDRNAPPQLGPPPSFKHAPVQHVALANGVPVILFEKHEVPLVQINVLIKSGITSDPAGKGGLGNFVASMLTDGAGTRDALQLADAIDYLGADLHASAGFHSTTISLSTTLSKLDSALALLADVTLRPTFPQAELDRQKKERLTTMLQWRDEPRALASVSFNRALYGADHPYGLPSIGDERSLQSTTVEDLKAYHAQHFCANNAVIVVVGDVTVAGMKPKLEAAFGTWKRGTIPTRPLPDIHQVSKRSIVIVDKPGAAQTEIRIGRIGVARTSPDYFPLEVMNTLLGGSFSSRLNQNLREQHGYTYGARSRFDYRVLAGPFLVSTAVQTSVTDKALTECMKELRSILEPVPDADLIRGRNYQALGFPEQFQTVGQIARMLEELAQYGLPDDYYNTYVDRILGVKEEDLRRAARAALDPERVMIVLVGDRKVIEPGVKALNLGPIKNLTIEDVLGKAPVVEGK
jgi:zinc protease